MKLHFIYMSIGISTLLLNLALTLHLIRSKKTAGYKDARECGEVTTFKLTRNADDEGDTTLAAHYEDTQPLE